MVNNTMIDKMFGAFGVKTKIVCTSPSGKCKEDFNGLCYYCGRDMLGGKDAKN